MPRCVLGLACKLPTGEVRKGHPCRICGQGVHILCAVVDESQPASSNATCLICAGAISAPERLSGSVSTKKPAPTPTTTIPTTTTKQRRVALPSKKQPSSKKRQELQCFTVDAKKSLKDGLLLKPVAFDTHDGNYGEGIYNHFRQVFNNHDDLNMCLTIIADRSYLLGSVARQGKKNGSLKKYYDIQWAHNKLGFTPIDFNVVLAANELYMRIHKRPTTGNKSTPTFSKSARKVLSCADDINVGADPFDSDFSDSISDTDDERHTLTVPIGRHPPISGSAPQEGYCWSVDCKSLPPPNLSNRQSTHVDPKHTAHFKTPVSSFLAFLPIKLFNAFASYSNMYAHDVMEMEKRNCISGAKWDRDITLQEMMVFFGILLKMVLHPTPGRCYTKSWTDTNMHPYTKAMSLRRFQQIRSVLHFNDNSKANGSLDSAFKVRQQRFFGSQHDFSAIFFNFSPICFLLDAGSAITKHG